MRQYSKHGMRLGAFLALLLLLQPSLVHSQDRSPVADWLRKVSSGDYAVRLQTTYSLREIGDPHEAVRLLIHALQSSDSYTRKCAAIELGETGLEPSSSVPALVNLLNDPDEQVRTHAAIALSKLGEPAIPGLLSILANVPTNLDSPRIPKHLVYRDGCHKPVYIPAFLAALALGRIGNAAGPALTSVLANKLNRGAVYALFGIEAGKVTAPQLLSLVRSSDSANRGLIGAAFWSAVTNGGIKLEALTSLMNSSDPGLRLLALEGIAWWVDRDPSAIPPLIAGLSDPDPSIRAAAAMSVAHVNVGFSLAWANLAARLADPDRAVVKATLEAMQEIQIPGADKHLSEAVPSLVKLLQRDDPDLQTKAAWVLDKIGKPAAPATPALLLLLKSSQTKDESNDPHHAAISALGHIGGDATSVGELTEMLKRGSRYEASIIASLGEIGTSALAAAPAVAERLKSPNQYVRREAAKALVRMGEIVILLSDTSQLSSEMNKDVISALGEHKVSGPETVDFLLSIIEGGNGLAGDAARALGEIGVKNERVIRDLTNCLSKPRLAPEAATALARLAPESVVALPQLILLLDSHDLRTRETAVRAIAALGPKGSPAIPALLKSLPPSSDPVVSGNSVFYENRLATEGVINALLRIGPAVLIPLTEYLRNRENPDLIAALGKLGSVARSTTPQLISFIRSESPKVRIAAMNSLVLIDADPELTTAALSRLLLDPDSEVRIASAELLLRGGFEKDDQIPVVQTIANDEFVSRYMRESFSSLIDKYFNSLLKNSIS